MTYQLTNLPTYCRHASSAAALPTLSSGFSSRQSAALPASLAPASGAPAVVARAVVADAALANAALFFAALAALTAAAA